MAERYRPSDGPIFRGSGRPSYGTGECEMSICGGPSGTRPHAEQVTAGNRFGNSRNKTSGHTTNRFNASCPSRGRATANDRKPDENSFEYRWIEIFPNHRETRAALSPSTIGILPKNIHVRNYIRQNIIRLIRANLSRHFEPSRDWPDAEEGKCDSSIWIPQT